MYSRKLVLAALAGGLLMTTTLSAQRNYPKTRPTTVGKSILTNGGFEDLIPADLPTPPSIPSKYPKHLLPDLPHDTFYEDGDEPEEEEAGAAEAGDDDEGGEQAPIGGFYGKILEYFKKNNIKYSKEDIKEFKTFFDKYIEYLKKTEKFSKAMPTGWYLEPRNSSTSFNKFFRITDSPAEGKLAMRLVGTYGQAHQIFNYPDFIPVNSKAQYLIAFKYRGNAPLDHGGYPLKTKELAFIRLNWKAKSGTKLKLDGKELPMKGGSWQDDRNNSNSNIKDAQIAYNSNLRGMDFNPNDPLTWKEKYMIVDAPENAESVSIALMFPEMNGDIANFKVDIDDISMTLIKGHEGEPNLPKLVVPNAPTAKSLGTTYIQREFAVQWEKSTDAVDGYEVEVAEVNGTATQNPTTYKTTDTSYTFEGMTPGKTYQVRVRSTKGEAKSEYSAAFKVQTKALGEFTNEGIPFLSTVSEDGSAPQNLPLYFLELKNPEAKLTCFIDDQEVAPTNKILQFPSTGNHTLRIIVEEATDRIWELSYELNIK